MLDESLARLRDPTPIDLVQFHEVIRFEDPDRIFAPGGALEAAVAARQAGKIRYIGFTGHKDPHIHLRMLEIADQHNFHFDTVQMPINVMDAHFRSFTRELMPVAIKKGIGVLAMKDLRATPLSSVTPNSSSPSTCCTTALPSPSRSLSPASTSPQSSIRPSLPPALFKPLSDSQVAAILDRTKSAALTPAASSSSRPRPHFDGTAANPKWLGPASST